MMKHGLNFKKLVVVALAFSQAAFTGPQKDDLVELKGFLYGRNSAQFRAIDNNQVLVLKPGTRALIKETKFFPASKNYGICLEVKNPAQSTSTDKCLWVYYNADQPNMNLYSAAQDKEKRDKTLEAWTKESGKDLKVSEQPVLKKETRPEQAQAAETTKAVTAVRETVQAPASSATASEVQREAKLATGKPSKVASGTDSNASAARVIKGVDELNTKASAIMSKNDVAPTPSCPDGKCNQTIHLFESCRNDNNYLEAPLAAILNSNSVYANFYNGPQREIIRRKCIENNLIENGGGGSFHMCAGQSAQRVRAKACVSENYVKVTSKAFNLSAECFGAINGNSEASKKQFGLAVFSLMAQESGMHMNVSSGTGAGGPGQLTDDAIQEVNKNLFSIRSQLTNAASVNPNCGQVLAQVFSKPMSTSGTCERVGLSQNNPLKNIAYSFAYQNIVFKSLNTAYFQSETYKDLISHLSEEQAARLKYSLAGWGHNTGPGGLQGALRGLLRQYVRQKKTLSKSADVDRFLADLRSYMSSRENKNFYSNIQDKVALITAEPTSCLAN